MSPFLETMDLQPVSFLPASGGDLIRNLTQPLFEHRQLLQISKGREEEEEAYFVDYIPPARDAITLPRNVVYVLVGVILVIVATYAIVGHLIKDLMHDLADWILGPKPVDDDTEEGRAEMTEEQQVGMYSGLAAIEGCKMEEEEREGLLPGIHKGVGSCHSPTPPLRSAITTCSREKRMSTHSVTFACPLTPYVTSL